MLLLARTVFHCRLREIRLTRDELLEWQAEYAIEPWGEIRTDIGFAKVCAMVGNGAGGKRGGGTFAPLEFMPAWVPDEKPKAPVNWDEAKAMVQAMVLARGGRVKMKDGTVIQGKKPERKQRKGRRR